jgi:hypothetical protein
VTPPPLATTSSDLLAAGLVLAFMVLVYLALRASLEPRPRRRSAAAPTGSPAAPSASTHRLLRSRLDRIETRLAHLEQRLRTGVAGPLGEEDPPRSDGGIDDTLLGRSAPALAEAALPLADAGLSPREIAQRLGEPVGRVELILNLRRSSPAADRRAGGDPSATTA